ncbi:MAG: hypothetical protein AAFN41_07300 [Planctomycetota bacterium]
MTHARAGGLFGGALLTAGLGFSAENANAQVSAADFEFQGTTPLNRLAYAPNGYDLVDLGNESFSVTGGFELVPFGRSAFGGIDGNPYADTASAVVVADASLAGGAFTFDAEVASDVFLQFGDSSDQTSATAIANFTVTGDSEYVFSGEADLIAGTWGVKLTDAVGGTVFSLSPSGAFGIDALSESGELPAGDYTLEMFTLTTGASFGEFASIDAVLTVVPGPGTAGLVLFAGVAATRRRR